MLFVVVVGRLLGGGLQGVGIYLSTVLELRRIPTTSRKVKGMVDVCLSAANQTSSDSLCVQS